jgi:hypothetical protein
MFMKELVELRMDRTADTERVNGILKNEYLAHHVVNSLVQAGLVPEQAIFLYNYKRPHLNGPPLRYAGSRCSSRRGGEAQTAAPTDRVEALLPQKGVRQRKTGLPLTNHLSPQN